MLRRKSNNCIMVQFIKIILIIFCYFFIPLIDNKNGFFITSRDNAKGFDEIRDFYFANFNAKLLNLQLVELIIASIKNAGSAK